MNENQNADGGALKHGVRCPVHNLHYNPELTEGCVLCRREAKAAKPRSSGVLWIWIVSLCILALISYPFLRPFFPSGERASDVSNSEGLTASEKPSREGFRSQRIDPSPFRERIEQIERTLYKSVPPASEDLDKIESSAHALSEELRQGDSPGKTSRLATEVLFWAGRLTAQQDVGYSLPELSRARSEWEELRDRHFKSTSWMRRTTRALEEAQRPIPPEVDGELVAGLRHVALGVGRLIEEGQADCGRLGEILGEGDRAAQQKISEWHSWSRIWESRVQSVADTLPNQPGMSADLNVTMAHQSLGFALNNLRLVPVAANDFGVPFHYEREGRFKEASGHLQSAEKYLAKLSH